MTPPSILVSAILALELLTGRIAEGAGSQETVQCPLTVLHGRLYVRATLQGQSQPNWWLLDTGSPVSLVNEEDAKQLTQSNPGIKEQTVVISGRSHSVLKSVGINIAGQSVGPFDFLTYPSLGALDANKNSRVGFAQPFQTGGVLGLNFLLQHRARFNFSAQSYFLTLGNGSSGVSPGGFEGFTAVPIQITARGRIEVSGSVGSQLYSFLLDTGSRRSVIDWNIKTTNQIPVRLSGRLYFGLIDKQRLVATGDLQNFKLGTLDVSKKFAQFADLAGANITVSHLGFSHPFGGIMGEDVLWDHQAILDLGGRTLYLK